MNGEQAVWREGTRIRIADGTGYGDQVPDDEIRKHIGAATDPTFLAFAEAVLAIRAFERVTAQARSRAEKLARTVRERDEALSALREVGERIEALHKPMNVVLLDGVIVVTCAECRRAPRWVETVYPCPTLLALRGTP